jgi:2'-5' RNA ligase
MDYAVVLYFDDATEERFNKIIKAVSESQEESYMLDKKIPPHITISFFRTEKIDEIVGILNQRHLDFTMGNIYWATLGAFIPEVLFAAPVLSDYLLNACISANLLFKDFADFNVFYLPYQWVPHTTLATKLSQIELNKAFEIATKNFTAFGGKSSKIVLVECNPYREIKTWDLSTV